MARSTSFIQVTTSGFTHFEKALESVFLQGVVLPTQETLRKSAEDIAFIAKEMAPLKSGSLEYAIEQPDRKLRRDGFKVGAMVWVNPRVWNPDSGLRVGDYAEEAHENITPEGDKNLGPLSEAKQTTVDVEVGGGFMTRAWEFSKPWVVPRVADAVHEALQKYNR